MGIPSPLGVSASGLPAKGDVANAVLSGTFSGVGPSAPFAFIGPMNFSIYASLVDTLTTTAGSLSATVATGTGIAAGDAINSTLVPLGTTLGALSGTTATLALAPITLMGSTQGFYPGAPGVINGLYQTNGLLGATVTGPNISANTTVTKIIQPYIGDGTFPVRGFKQLGIVQISNAPTAINNNNLPVPFVFTPTANGILASGTDSAAVFTGSNVTYVGSVQLERSARHSASLSVRFSIGLIAQPTRLAKSIIEFPQLAARRSRSLSRFWHRSLARGLSARSNPRQVFDATFRGEPDQRRYRLWCVGCGITNYPCGMDGAEWCSWRP